MKRYAIILIVAFLAGVTLFSVFRAIVVQRENAQMNASLRSAAARMGILDTERQKLFKALEKRTNELAALRAEKERLASVEIDLVKAQQTVSELSAEMSLVREENSELRNQQESVRQQISSITQENTALQQRLNSLAELKKAIGELKRKIHHERWHPRESDSAAVIDGNCGFLLRDGQSTFPSKVRIEVNPAR